MNDNYNTPNSGCCGRPMNYDTTPKCNYNNCCMNEYAYKQKACIRNKQPDCEAQAVIPSITVESIEGITNLANCFVHVSDINTTFYVDDKHRVMVTWSGLVSVEDYDFESNPLNLRSQIAYDKNANTAAIYDNKGNSFIFQISDFDNDYALLENKPSINGVELVGNKTSSDLGIQELTAGEGIQIENNVVSVEPEKKIKFHSVAGSSATYIVEFPNGKNMIIDTGTAAQWDAIKTAIDSLGITKFDYAVVTHFHADHYGNVANIIDTYDAQNWFIQMKPDYTNHAAQILDSESAYDNQVAVFTSRGITPVVPVNNSVITVDEDTSIRFLNTDPTIAEGYYTRYSDSRGGGIDFNMFSVLVEITYKNIKFLATGDTERPIEDAYVSYIGKINVMTTPHHGMNRDANRAFYYAAMTDFAICAFPSNISNWAQPTYNSLLYLKETGAKVISSYSSIPVDGLYSFVSDGETVFTTTLDSAFTNEVYNYGEVYTHIGSIIDYTTYEPTTITLIQALNNMPRGSILRQRWDPSYDTEFPQLSSDLKALFPQMNWAYVTLDFRPLWDCFEIIAYDNSIEFTARTSRTNVNWVKYGHGVYNVESILSQSDLLTFLQNIPIGQYSIHYYKDTNGDSGVLDTDAGYTLSVEKTANTTAMITGVMKVNATGNDKARAVFGYVSGLNATPVITWHKVNN